MSEKNNNSSKKQTIGNLTARQQEILELMQQGKVNKEIARTLDISLGTVKQHLVAIFKKLNVQNRTMAVTRLAEFKDQSGFSAVFASETLFARRPAIVLSLKMNGRLPRSLKKQFHISMSEFAFDSQALFITHQPGEGDLVFGLKRSSTQDIRTALIAASHMFREMRQCFTEQSGLEGSYELLTGALVAGLINISQNRFGGWSGETVGSHVLAWGHKLRNSAADGMLYFDEPVKTVMSAFDISITSDRQNPQEFPLEKIEQLLGWNVVENSPLIGRDKELSAVRQLLDSRFCTLIIEGESGMGKSRLCREAVRIADSKGLSFIYIRLTGFGFYAASSGNRFETWLETIAWADSVCPDLIVVDDAHLLSEEDKVSFNEYLCSRPQRQKVIVSGRQPQSYSLDSLSETTFCKVHLGRLSSHEMNILMQKQASECSLELQRDISERSRGIPLFAKELLFQHKGEGVSLPLLITVASRIDKFQVDWKLLYCVSAHPGAVSTMQLSGLMKDDLAYICAAVDRATKIGILTVDDDLVSFRHPLVQEVVCYLFQPRNTPHF